MTILRTYGVFIGLSLLSWILLGWAIPVEAASFFFLAAIVIGIPHGALDHIIATRMLGQPLRSFLLKYLTTMLFVALIWWASPPLGFVAFLIYSALHFGQSQLDDLPGEQLSRDYLYQLAWGIFVLSSIFVFDAADLALMMSAYPDSIALASILSADYMIWALCLSAPMLILGTIDLMRRERLSPKRLGQEAFIMAIILFNAYLLPFAWSFALYFCILHSSRVLQEEYVELRAHRIVQDVKSFLLLATPFSVLSYIGIVFLYIASAQGIIAISPLLIVLAIVAVITLPHGVVMDYFYRHGHS